MQRLKEPTVVVCFYSDAKLDRQLCAQLEAALKHDEALQTQIKVNGSSAAVCVWRTVTLADNSRHAQSLDERL